MVYDNDTFEPLHRIAPEAEQQCKDYLVEQASQENLMQEHPIVWLFKQIKVWFN